jgi:hypothetical protein
LRLNELMRLEPAKTNMEGTEEDMKVPSTKRSEQAGSIVHYYFHSILRRIDKG